MSQISRKTTSVFHTLPSVETTFVGMFKNLALLGIKCCLDLVILVLLNFFFCVVCFLSVENPLPNILKNTTPNIEHALYTIQSNFTIVA